MYVVDTPPPSLTAATPADSITCCVSWHCVRRPQVPPYARAGLYKQLATLKDLVREFREDATKNAALRPVIAANMQQAGLYEDLPYPCPGVGGGGVLTAEEAEELPAEGEVTRDSEPFFVFGKIRSDIFMNGPLLAV